MEPDTDNLIRCSNKGLSAAIESASVDNGDDDEVFPPENVTLPKRTTVYMEPLTVLFCVAFQGLAPLISQYVYYRMSLDLGLNATSSSGSSQCNASDKYANSLNGNASGQYALTQQVQDRTSTWILYRGALAAIGALLSIPLISSSSDRVGRRIALILPCLGTLAESAVSLCVVWLDLPLFYMLIAALACGLCGGIGGLFAGALSYLADVTTSRARPMRITVLEALTGVGGAATCVLIGWWIRWQGYLIPHLFCTSVYIIAAAFCLFVVPEIRQPPPSDVDDERRSSFLMKLGYILVEPVRGFVSLMSRPHSLPAVYCLVLLSLSLYCAAFYGTMDLTVLYSMNYPFCLDSVFIGYFSAARQAALQLGMLLTVCLCTAAGMSTLTIASIGSASTAAGAVLLAVAWDQSVLWLSIAAAAASACPVPMYRAFVSMVTPADKQGCIFSAFGVIQMLSYLIGNLAFTNGYKATLMWQPGFVFYTVAATMLAGLLLTIFAEAVYRCRTLSYSKTAVMSSEILPDDSAPDSAAFRSIADSRGSVQWNGD